MTLYHVGLPSSLCSFDCRNNNINLFYGGTFLQFNYFSSQPQVGCGFNKLPEVGCCTKYKKVADKLLHKMNVGQIRFYLPFLFLFALFSSDTQGQFRH